MSIAKFNHGKEYFDNTIYLKKSFVNRSSTIETSEKIKPLSGQASEKIKPLSGQASEKMNFSSADQYDFEKREKVCDLLFNLKEYTKEKYLPLCEYIDFNILMDFISIYYPE